MATLRIEKVDGSLPGVLTPDTLYFVKIGSAITVYISDSTGSSAYATSSGASDAGELHPFLLMGVS